MKTQTSFVGNSIRAVLMGLGVGLLGSVVHANVSWVSDTMFIPWGIVVALALALAATLSSGLSAGSAGFAFATGLIAYLVVGLFALGIPKAGLISIDLSIVQGTITSPVMGLMWVGGLALMVCLGTYLTGREVRKLNEAQAREKAGLVQQNPQQGQFHQSTQQNQFGENVPPEAQGQS